MRLVYLSPVAWNSHTQRPHYLVEWFHNKTDGDVMWVDPYPTRLPLWRDLRDLRNKPPDLASPPPKWLKIVSPKALPVEPLPGIASLNRWLWGRTIRSIKLFVDAEPCVLGIGKPSELALQLLSAIRLQRSFYDAMDDFPAFYGGISRNAMLKREFLIVSKVSRMIVSSTELMNRWSVHRKDLALSLNGCAVESLPQLSALHQQSPAQVLGYIGTIGEWFDWDIVLKLARTVPSMRIRLIGPIASSVPDNIPTNIEILGPCRHDGAIAEMVKFCVGIIPFKRNRLTASVDPIKYYEYRSLGLPVISTRFGEMSLRENEPGVFLIDRCSDLAEAVGAAKNYQMSLADIEQFRISNSWTKRFDSAKILA